MQSTKRMLSFLLVPFFLLATLHLAFYPASASSDTTKTEIELEPGSLDLSGAPSIHFYADLADQRRSSLTIDGMITGPLVVEDGRGTERGWNVSVSLGTFTMADSKTTALRGAQLTLGAPMVAPAEGVKEPIVGYPAVLLAGDGIFHKVISLPPGTSGGAWNGSFSDASLLVKENTGRRGVQRATLMWQIEDTP